MTNVHTDVDDVITSGEARWSRGRSVGLVAFLFGVSGRDVLPGTALRRMLEDLGLSPDAARALLSRMCRHGQLASERRGRYADYRLAGEFAQGFERVRTLGNHVPPGWSGHFHAVLYSVPERHRAFRDALRRTALLAGYGILQQGVIISATDRSRQLRASMRTMPPDVHVWVTTLGMTVPEAARAASAAWDLPRLAGLYRAHVERLAVPPDDRREGRERLGGYVDTLLPALTDTLREPRLAPALMPADWPGPELVEAIGRYTDAFAPEVETYLHSLLP